ncbi:unnamed protein product [Blepharisma stoltei]|uniref:Uncharacterized protein n=1 Tax=Blepharisma stoltei TaxID=1481888 RepID=A0AAU9JRB3_9CILI|nr:unnamed protein product [Blepharisma stoltei]
MVFVSLLTPAFEIQRGISDLYAACNERFGTSSIKIYRLTPVEQIENEDELVAKLDCNLSLSAIENLLNERAQIQIQLERAKEALNDYSFEIKKLKENARLSKPQKIKKLEIENKKLKENFKTNLDMHTEYMKEMELKVNKLNEKIEDLESKNSEKDYEKIKKEENKDQKDMSNLNKIEIVANISDSANNLEFKAAEEEHIGKPTSLPIKGKLSIPKLSIGGLSMQK